MNYADFIYIVSSVLGWCGDMLDIINDHVLLQVLIIISILDIYVKRISNIVMNNDERGDNNK